MKLLVTILSLVFSAVLNSNPIAGFDVYLQEDPIDLITTTYDYFLSAKNGVSVRHQNYNAGHGSYALFHSTSTGSNMQRVYYSYFNSEGNIINCATISINAVEEGFPSLDIDPVTGDPIAAWNSENGIKYSYDYFHLGSSGLWATPYSVFDENVPLSHPDDNFLYPLVEIGTSPIPDKRRVYIVAENQRIPTIGEEYDNAMLAYADFDVNDFNFMIDFDWTYVPLQFSDEPYIEEYDPFTFTFTTSDEGHLAIVGTSYYHDVFALINTEYGQGDFVLYSESFKFPVDNPLNLDGIARFADDQGNPYDIFFAPLHFTNTNAIFTFADYKVIFPTNFALMAEPDVFFDDELLVYPKVIVFDLAEEEFSYKNIHIGSDYPNLPDLILPWDLDNNGQVDSYDMDGKVSYFPSWPIYYFSATQLHTHDLNYFRISKDEFSGNITIMWNDGARAKYAQLNNAGYGTWDSCPEIAFSVSDSYGEYWNQTQFVNPFEDPQLAGQIISYVNTCNEFRYSSNGDYILYAIFLDEYSYGPSFLHPNDNGGIIKAMKLIFQPGEPPIGVSITEPSAGVQWILGETFTIEWTEVGNIGPFDIDLVVDNDFVLKIEEDLNSNSIDWTIPDSIPTAGNYRIRIMAHYPAFYWISDLFSIIEPENANNILNVRNQLFQNTPNPFNPITTISFSLNTEITENTELVIYNSKGQKVKDLSPSLCHPELVEGREDNEYSVIWDGKDDSGKSVSSGVYLYKLKTGDFEDSKKMLLLK